MSKEPTFKEKSTELLEGDTCSQETQVGIGIIVEGKEIGPFVAEGDYALLLNGVEIGQLGTEHEMGEGDISADGRGGGFVADSVISIAMKDIAQLIHGRLGDLGGICSYGVRNGLCAIDHSHLFRSRHSGISRGRGRRFGCRRVGRRCRFGNGDCRICRCWCRSAIGGNLFGSRRCGGIRCWSRFGYGDRVGRSRRRCGFSYGYRCWSRFGYGNCYGSRLRCWYSCSASGCILSLDTGCQAEGDEQKVFLLHSTINIDKWNEKRFRKMHFFCRRP